MAQTTSCIIMVKPTYFVFNSEAAVDNAYMNEPSDNVEEKVCDEFNQLVEKLSSMGVCVNQFDSPLNCPDAVFPNNWFATFIGSDNNKYFELFSMKSVARRAERNNPELLEFLKKRYSVDHPKYDWSASEKNDKYFEGTGSIVVDRVNRVAFVAESERSNPELAREWASTNQFSLVLFKSADKEKPVYHTNVIMAIGQNFAVVAMECILEYNRAQVKESLEKCGKTIINISLEQVSKFCGNVIELTSENHKRILVMSTQAYVGYTSEQKQTFFDLGVSEIVHSDISTIEYVGGGSARCMIAEVF